MSLWHVPTHSRRHSRCRQRLKEAIMNKQVREVSNHALGDAQIKALMTEVLNESGPEVTPVSRRMFLKLAGLSSGGLALAFCFNVGDAEADAPTNTASLFKANAYIEIYPDDAKEFANTIV